MKSKPLGNGKPATRLLPAGKKIMFVLPKATAFGGLERHLLDLLQRLPEQLQPRMIICFDQDIITARMDQDQREQVAVRCVKEPQSLWDWLRIMREHDPDIIVFHYSWIKAFPWQAPVAATLAGIRRRISIQQLLPTPLPPPVQGKSPRDRLRRMIGRRARDILKAKISARVSAFLFSTTVCVSSAVRDTLVKIYGVSPRKTVVIFNGVSTLTFTPSPTEGAAVRARLDIAPEDFLLVCIARLVAEKGVDVVIRAVSEVLRQGVNCKCIILGDGPHKEKLVQKVHSEGLSDHVFFEGFQHDVRSYLQAASAFILTSRIEGLPISVLEAMACGLPCIVTNVGGNAEAVKDQVTGLVIPPSSVEAAANAILYLATNPDKRAGMAGKAREEVKRSFDVEDRMAELIRVMAR